MGCDDLMSFQLMATHPDPNSAGSRWFLEVSESQRKTSMGYRGIIIPNIIWHRTSLNQQPKHLWGCRFAALFGLSLSLIFPAAFEARIRNRHGGFAGNKMWEWVKTYSIF
jgi:hypothetical protein